LVLVLGSGAAAAQPSYNNSTCLRQDAGTSLNVTLTGTQPGSLLVVGVTVKDLATTIEVKDDLGNAFQPVFSPPILGTFLHQSQVFFANNGPTGGDDVITATIQNDAVLILYVHEYVGFSPAAEVEAQSAEANNGPDIVSGTITTTSAPDVLFWYAVSHSLAVAPPAGFSVRERCSQDLSADFVTDAGGTWNVVTPQSDDGGYMGMLVAFRSTRPDGGDLGTDAGITPRDAGAEVTDAGPEERDGGTEQPDAGTQPSDAGTTSRDAGLPVPDGGTLPQDDTVQFRACGCSSGPAELTFALLLMLTKSARARTTRRSALTR